MATIGNLWINVKSNTKGLSNGLGKARGMLGKFGKFAASPAGIAVAAFAALTAGIIVMTKALSSAIKEFMKFEAGMAEVASVMLDIDPSKMKEMTDLAKELGRTTKFTGEEAAQGMAMLARAGFKASENMEALPAVLDLAAASGMELAETADIVATVLKGFGLDASEAAHVADVLAVGATSANTTVSALGEAFQHVAPLARELGFSVEETTAILAIMQDQGIKAGKAGTGFRVVLSKMGAAIEKHGTGALREYLKEGHSFTENLEKFDKLGVNAVSILGRMTEETADLTTTMNEVNGVVSQMAEARLDTLAGDVTKWKSAVSGLKVEIGEKLAPTLRKVTQVATEFIGAMQAAFMAVFGDVQGAIVSTEQLQVTFKTLGVVIILVGTAVGKMYHRTMFAVNTIEAAISGLSVLILNKINKTVKAISWAMNQVGMMGDDTYETLTLTADALVEELGEGAKQAAIDAGHNFMMGYGGGVEKAGFEALAAFNNSMDGIIDKSKETGKEVSESLPAGVGEGAKKAAEETDKLNEAQQALVLSSAELAKKLQEQVTYFGMTEAEILKVKQAKLGLTTATIEQALALEKELQAMKDAETAKQKAIQDAEALASAAQSVIDSLRTPQEIYDAEVANLQKMFDAKLLTIEQFATAVDKLKMGTEDDIEVNVVMKGVVEGLQTALGTVKIGGQVDDTLRVAEEGNDIQQKIAELMASVENATVENMNLNEGTEKSVAETADAVQGTLTTEVDGLEGMIGEVNSSIGTIATGLTMDATEGLIKTTNELSLRQWTELQNVNRNLVDLKQGNSQLT